ILSSCTIFEVFCRATAGELSSSTTVSSTGRPLMPPELLMRSIAICRPITAVLPPAAPGPDSGCSEPILYGLAAPNAARHGAGTSIRAPIAPPPQPTSRRRVSLPRYQISSAHFSSFHFSVIGCSSLAVPWHCHGADWRGRRKVKWTLVRKFRLVLGTKLQLLI